MAITLTQQPGNYNLAYGINPVTLHGLTVEDKYVLQILQGSTVLADIRQTPNENGNAEFDIQNILQTYVKPSGLFLPNTTNFADSEEEVFEYNIAYGTETDGEIDTPLNIEIGLKVIGGRKDYYDLQWNEARYIPTVGSDGEGICTEVEYAAQALTDWSEYKLISDITDEVPDWSVATDKVYTQKVRPSDNFTLSLLNVPRYGANPPTVPVDTVKAFRLTAYDEFGTLVFDYKINNGVTTNDTVVTAGVGPAQTAVGLYPAVKYYYIGFPVATPTECVTEFSGFTDQSAWDIYRFDVVDDKCNDYTPIQFSWLNSFGFRDYFYFEKKNERRVNISRNNYLAESNDFSIGVYSSPLEARGYTTYSQKLEETYVANTRFLQDYEATFLENLFISPDVRVRFGDDAKWYPVTLLSTSYTERNYRKDKLFQYEIAFKKAHNIKSQRG